MLEILEASHGGLTTLDSQLSDYESLEQLVGDAAAAAGMPADNVLLFLEDGRDVKEELLQEMYERGGTGGQSDPPVQQLFLFNRETFYANSAETWAVQYQEDLVLPPPLNLSAISDLDQAQQPFVLASDHVQHLLSLFSAQARALSIAYTSLSAHLQPLLREFDEFQERAKAELENEDRLIRSSAADMVMLHKIVVHDAFNAKKRDRRNSMDGHDAPWTMDKFVNPAKMGQVRESCQAAYANNVKQFEKLADQIEELALQSEAERRAAEDRAQQVQAEFEACLDRFQEAAAHLELLFQDSTPSLSQDLMELDSAMREDLEALTHVKNDFTLDLHIHFRQVADFQIRITELVTPIHTLDSELQSRAAFPHLHRLHQLPLAYAATVVEVVRRKEFGAALQDWTNRLSSTLTDFASNERSRRVQVQEDALSQLPFLVPALSDASNPKFVLNVTTGSEGLDELSVGQGELQALTDWISALKRDTALQQAILDAESDPIPYLEHGLSHLMARMDEATVELDQMIERSVLLHRANSQRETRNLQDRLDALANENTLLRQQAGEHQSHLRRAEEAHEQRTRSLQNRQAELQDELMRLRNDFSEEMTARQALSTELGDRAREFERDRDDQAEILSALQAELRGEKDRATDLGVRLQEALLDVDGLRNGEQALQAQIHSLQDERSNLLQSVSHAQNETRQIESQLAGVQAELAVTAQQLSQAQSERDAALKNQSAEAERLMRDHIAETDGDRAVLEHQNLTLTKQVETIRIEMEEKITAARNAAVRTADGLKAELSFTKAQLRESQRRETVQADELAMAKDTAQAMASKDTHQSDVARDAVMLATKYYDACQRLMSTITASSTIAASTHITRPKSVEHLPAISTETPMRDSILVRSLATAGTFDLANFSDAVNKTITLVKKLNKSCRYYRDAAKNKISFTSFAKGDLALFLPTRNATTRPWMAFNASAPHHFLKVPLERAEAWKVKDSIIARIVNTEEAVAGDSAELNPFGLAEGLRFYIHQVEEYSPTVVPRPSRRSTSTHLAERTSESAPPAISPSVTARPPASEPILASSTSPSTDRKGYFPLQSSPISIKSTTETVTPARPAVASVVGSPVDRASIPPAETPISETPQSQSSRRGSIESPTPPAGDPAKLSPVFESFASPVSMKPIPAAPPLARPAPPFAIRPPSGSFAPQPRPPSRASLASAGKRESPVFAPSSFGRPVSVASSGGSYTQPSMLTAVIKSAAAPVMATPTLSGASGGSGTSAASGDTANADLGPPVARRGSSDIKRQASFARIPSSGAMFPMDEHFRSSPEVPSPLSRQVSQPIVEAEHASGRASRIAADPFPALPRPGTSTTAAQSSQTTSSSKPAPQPSFAPSPAPEPEQAGQESRFWTLGRKRLGSFAKQGTADEGKGGSSAGAAPAPTARDLLRRFDS